MCRRCAWALSPLFLLMLSASADVEADVPCTKPTCEYLGSVGSGLCGAMRGLGLVEGILETDGKFLVKARYAGSRIPAWMCVDADPSLLPAKGARAVYAGTSNFVSPWQEQFLFGVSCSGQWFAVAQLRHPHKSPKVYTAPGLVSRWNQGSENEMPCIAAADVPEYASAAAGELSDSGKCPTWPKALTKAEEMCEQDDGQRLPPVAANAGGTSESTCTISSRAPKGFGIGLLFGVVAAVLMLVWRRLMSPAPQNRANPAKPAHCATASRPALDRPTSAPGPWGS